MSSPSLGKSARDVTEVRAATVTTVRRLFALHLDTRDRTHLGLDLGVAKVYSSIDLNRADMISGAALNGATYILNTDFLEMPLMEAPSITPFTERVGDQDVVTAIFSMQGNLICTKTPAQGCVSGGAV